MSRTVLITGCSTGIGRSTALAFARSGDRVYATMRDPRRGAALQESIREEGLDGRIVQLDVTDPASVHAAAATVLAAEGGVDVVVNNAGMGLFAPIEHTDDEHWLATFDTNLFGAVRVTRSFLPLMRERGSGVIINVSSIAGRLASIPTQGAYAASKHALCALTDSLVAECTPFGITAHCIEPGFFATAIMEGDTVVRLDDGDPYKDLTDGVQGFFRDSLMSAPPPDEVAALILEASSGALDDGGHHHPVGMPGFTATTSSERDAAPIPRAESV